MDQYGRPLPPPLPMPGQQQPLPGTPGSPMTTYPSPSAMLPQAAGALGMQPPPPPPPPTGVDPLAPPIDPATATPGNPLDPTHPATFAPMSQMALDVYQRLQRMGNRYDNPGLANYATQATALATPPAPAPAAVPPPPPPGLPGFPAQASPPPLPFVGDNTPYLPPAPDPRGEQPYDWRTALGRRR